eukprot:SAG22_NODE_3_length_48349_cov_158.681180_34_plen_907_part_00
MTCVIPGAPIPSQNPARQCPVADVAGPSCPHRSALLASRGRARAVMLLLLLLLASAFCSAPAAPAAAAPAAAAPAAAAAAAPAGHVSACMVSGFQHGEHATGVGPAVQLGWQLSHASKGARQWSFELEIDALTHLSAADTPDAEGSATWRTGAVRSARQSLDTAAAAAAGRAPSAEPQAARSAQLDSERTQSASLSVSGWQPLPPGTLFRFRVRATFTVGGLPPSAASPVCEGTFETTPSVSAFPGPARWIGGGGQLHHRTGLVLPAEKQIRSARAWVSGVGAFYLYLDGKQVGVNLMDPPQSVYSKRVLYETFDLRPLLRPGSSVSVDALLGNYKFGYTDIWCNMTSASGPDGCRALVLKASVMLDDGTEVLLDTSAPADWGISAGPVAWDHFFHGENYSALVGITAPHPLAADGGDRQQQQAREIVLPPGFPAGMQVLDPETQAPTALGQLAPTVSPPLRAVEIHEAVSVTKVTASDVGSAGWVFDFGQTMAGMVKLVLPANHRLPRGTELRMEHAEIIAGPFSDTGGMCALCPSCGPCAPPDHAGVGGTDALRAGLRGNNNCGMNDAAGGDTCNTYCTTATRAAEGLRLPLRREPCFPHQNYKGAVAHNTPDRYIGDFNNANQTNIYIVGADGKSETYVPRFAGAGFRYAQITGLPAGVAPQRSWLTALKINANVSSASTLMLPDVSGTGSGTPDILNKIHAMVRASQTSNLWSIPTDCPQRERRGWTGDAQASSEEAMMNYHMQRFYTKYLDDIRDDQLRYNANHLNDTGALADVIPYDGIGGNPGCPVWSVVYVVIARNMYKHYGSNTLPLLKKHYSGLTELMDWFSRRADPEDGLLVTSCYGDWMGFDPDSRNSGSSSLTPESAVTAFCESIYVCFLNFNLGVCIHELNLVFCRRLLWSG